MNKQICFKEMVKALAKPGADVITGLNPQSAHLLHMAVGVSGEVGELIEGFLFKKGRDNLVEELGDIEFYIEGFGISLQPCGHYGNTKLMDDNIESVMLKMAMYAGEVLDAVKKSAVYEKPLNINDVITGLDNLLFEMGKFRFVHNITRQECFDANIKKLGKRYSDGGYSNQQAQDRADK